MFRFCRGSADFRFPPTVKFPKHFLSAEFFSYIGHFQFNFYLEGTSFTMVTEVKQPVKKAKAWKGEKRSGPAPARHIPWPEVRLPRPCSTKRSLAAYHTMQEDRLTDVIPDIQAPYFSRRRSHKDAGDGAEAYGEMYRELRDNYKLSQEKS
jgi:hypothetical protein